MKKSVLAVISTSVGLLLSVSGSARAAGVFDRQTFEQALIATTIATDSFEGVITPFQLADADGQRFVALDFRDSNNTNVLGGQLADPINYQGKILAGEVSASRNPPDKPTADGEPGRFATDGVKFFSTGGNFAIDLSAPVGAFGIDITDLGDFGSDCEAAGGTPDCTDTSGLIVTFMGMLNGQAVSRSASPLAETSDGFLSFIGYYEAGFRISRIEFTNLAFGLDGVGFDLATVGEIRTDTNQTPEPSTLILLAAAGFGMGFRRIFRNR